MSFLFDGKILSWLYQSCTMPLCNRVTPMSCFQREPSIISSNWCSISQDNLKMQQFMLYAVALARRSMVSGIRKRPECDLANDRLYSKVHRSQTISTYQPDQSSCLQPKLCGQHLVCLWEICFLGWSCPAWPCRLFPILCEISWKGPSHQTTSWKRRCHQMRFTISETCIWSPAAQKMMKPCMRH